MEGLRFVNLEDYLNRWSLDKVVEIVTKLQAYVNEKGVKNVMLHEVEDLTWSDPENQRYNIEIRYINERNNLMQQHLIMLKGEILDGNEFHKRRDEFYPRKEVTK